MPDIVKEETNMLYIILLLVSLLNNSSFLCMESKKIFELTKHEKPYACPYCATDNNIASLEEYLKSTRVALHRKLDEHVISEHKQQSNCLICPYPLCNKILHSPFRLNTHYWRMHSTYYKFPNTTKTQVCAACGDVHIHFDRFNDHMACVVHVDKKGKLITVTQFLEDRDSKNQHSAEKSRKRILEKKDACEEISTESNLKKSRHETSEIKEGQEFLPDWASSPHDKDVEKILTVILGQEKLKERCDLDYYLAAGNSEQDEC